MESLKNLINLDEHKNYLFENLVEVDIISKKEIDFNVHGNWISIYFDVNCIEGFPAIFLDTNIQIFGFSPFKRVWKLNENLEDYLFNNVIPKLLLLNGFVSFTQAELILELEKVISSEDLTYSMEEKLFSIEYWNDYTGVKDILEYNGTIITIYRNDTPLRLYIQKSNFIYVEINSSNDKKIFPWYFFVSPILEKNELIKTFISTILNY